MDESFLILNFMNGTSLLFSVLSNQLSTFCVFFHWFILVEATKC